MMSNMKLAFLLIIIPALSACSAMSNVTESSPLQGVEQASLNSTSDTSISKLISPTSDPIIALLTKRQAWCLLPEAERLQIDAVLRNQLGNASILQRLMLTSCAPAQYTKQSQRLIKSVDTSLLSEAERSLLMLIDANNRDILHSQQERDNIHSKLRHTIDGISDIETQINGDATPQTEGKQ
ncbi:Uncharacterised protein [Zhongshania aliphaticivorans]|nr:Uncharacterised protein [Zhongshania aliphaticivorans]